MLEIKLSNRPDVFTIDFEDINILGNLSWYSTHGGYVCARTRGPGKTKIEYLHRRIMNAEKGQLVDHIDRNPFNNQRSNLRLCSKSQNAMNMKKRKTSTCQYKGITRHKYGWTAQIKVNGIRRYLGLRPTELEAAKLYDEAAKLHFGEFANPNFPDTPR